MAHVRPETLRAGLLGLLTELRNQCGGALCRPM